MARERARSGRHRLTGLLALVTGLLTVVWLQLLILDMASAGPLDRFDQVQAHVARSSRLLALSYANAALITLFAVALMAALYPTARARAPVWALIGLVFLPIYGLLNLVVYLSQLVVVPPLLALVTDVELGAAAEVLLRLTLQLWPASAAAFFNNLAYAVLGIPSLIYGALFWHEGRLLRAGGLLLALNGVACIAGVMGPLAGVDSLSVGSVLGGVLFLAALVPISLHYLRARP